MPLDLLLATVLPIASVVVAVGLIGRFLPLPGGGRWVGAVAVGGGYAVAHLYLNGFLVPGESPSLTLPAFPPSSAVHGLFFAALGAGLLGLVESMRRIPVGLLWLLRFLLIRTVLWLLAEPFIENRWSAVEALLWMGGADLSLLLTWALAERLARRAPGASVPGAFALAGVAASVVLGAMSRSVALAQLAGALAAGMGILALLLLVDRRPLPVASAIGPAVVLLGGLSLYGHLYGARSVVALVALPFVPLAAWVMEVPLLRRRFGPRGRLGGRAAAVVLAAGVAIAWGRPAPDPPRAQDVTTESPVDDYGLDDDYPE